MVVSTDRPSRTAHSDAPAPRWQVTIRSPRVFRASRWQSFYRVKPKFAMPYIFASLEVAMVLSVNGAIVAQFVGVTKGLGYLILQEMHKLDTAMVFALLTVLSVLGIILSYIIRLVARWMLFWHESERMPN